CESREGDETGERAWVRRVSEFVGRYCGIGRRHYGGERRCGDAKNFCEIGRQPAGERERQVIYQLRDHYTTGAPCSGRTGWESRCAFPRSVHGIEYHAGARWLPLFDVRR